jgi:hypothetical protein
VSEWSIDIVTFTGQHLLLSGQGRMDYFAQHPHCAKFRLDRSWGARCCAFALVICGPPSLPLGPSSLPRLASASQGLPLLSASILQGFVKQYHSDQNTMPMGRYFDQNCLVYPRQEPIKTTKH